MGQEMTRHEKTLQNIIASARRLGVELDEEGLKSIPRVERKMDTWLREDGSVAFR